MDSALTIGLGLGLRSSSSLFQLTTRKPTLLPFPISKPPSTKSPFIRVKASLSNPTSKSKSNGSPNLIIHKLKTTAATIVFAASMIGKFQQLPARAETPRTEEIQNQQEIPEEESSSSSPLSEFLQSNSEAIDALKNLLQQKLEASEDEESLEIVKKLVSAQPEHAEWKFLMARVLNEMGQTQEARIVFEEILEKNPLSFEALFENALLMDRCGEGEAVIKRLEEALGIAEEEKKVKEARDVRLIMAQIQFLQKNVEEALRSYEELGKEDPNDFRPYFCKGMIYSLLDRNKEAREQFAKYRELSPKKFEVEGYLRTPLSRMKLFGTDDEEN